MAMMKFNRYVLPAIAAGFIALPASAATPIAEEAGFGGSLQLGVGMINAESNVLAKFLGADMGDDTTDNLSEPADSEVSPVPVVGISLTYTFSNMATELFLGSSIENMATLDFSSTLGLRQQIGNAGIIELSALATPLATEVWEDPYVTGTPREETDRNTDGFRLEWGGILGSGFDVAVSSREVDIDKERSGAALVADATITAAEQGLLDRNGDIDIARIAYTWGIEDGQLTVGVSAIDHDLDGEAMAYDGTSVEINHSVGLSERTSLVSSLSLGLFDFDKENPIYDEEDEMDTAEVSVVVLVNSPFGYKNWVGNAAFAYAQEDHDINFYDNDVALISLGASRQF